MKTVTQVQPWPVAKLLATYFFFFGLLYSLQVVLGIFRHEDILYAPLGLALPYVGFKVDLHLSKSFFWIAPFAYGVTGAIDGAVIALLYNLGARHLGGIEFKVARVAEAVPPVNEASTVV